MDLDEWELLPHDGFLDYHEDGDKKLLATSKRSTNQKGVFNMNYFMCPSSPPRKSMVVPNHLVPVAIELEPTATIKEPEDENSKQVVAKVPIDITVVPSVIMPKVKDDQFKGSSKEADQDSVSQVFFKKMKENEFVDMKMDSPKSCSPNKGGGVGGGFVPPQIDAGAFNFDDKTDQGMVMESKVSSPKIRSNEKEISTKEQVDWEEEEEEENGGGLNLWKWSLTGIGAICSFGVAAATICIIIFGTQQRNKQQQQQNQKLRFQIYTDDKRIKQVVQHATKLNEAISAVSGVPITRAHITYGGYHDGL